MRYFIIFCLLVVVSSWQVPAVYAATVNVESDFTNFHVGDIFSIEVVANTEGKVLNAVELEILYPADFLEYQDYDDGDSVINLWVEPPSLRAEQGVQLSGITPGGFSGRHEPILSLNFKVIKVGQGNIEINNPTMLVHDGLGTADSVAAENLHITATAGESQISVGVIDDEMPESFRPEIIYDPDVFAGAEVLIFSTEDKGSGLDHFAVKEGFFGTYIVATSPYLLQYQNRDRKIYVKATDKNNNERVEIVYPQKLRIGSEHAVIIFSILLLCLIALLVYPNIRRYWLRT